MKRFKNIIIVLVVIVMVTLFVSCGEKVTETNPDDTTDNVGQVIKVPGPEGVIATVGQVEIPIDDYVELLNSTRIALIDEGIDIDAEENAEIKISTQDEIIEGLIDTAVYVNYAKENDLMPSMKEIEDAVSREVNEQAVKVGSYDLLEQTLKDEGGVKELKKILRSDPKFIEKITKEKVIEHIRNQVVITDADIEEFYESRLLGLSEIVIYFYPDIHTDEDIDKARRYTEAVKKKIGTELTFSETAEKFSMEPTTAIDGGRYSELIPRGVLLEELEDAAFALKIGEVSDIIRTKDSFRILKLEYETYVWDYFFTEDGTKPKPELSTVKDQVEARLRMIREYEAEQMWYDEYRDSLDIKVYLELVYPEGETETDQTTSVDDIEE